MSTSVVSRTHRPKALASRLNKWDPKASISFRRIPSTWRQDSSVVVPSPFKHLKSCTPAVEKILSRKETCFAWRRRNDTMVPDTSWKEGLKHHISTIIEEAEQSRWFTDVAIAILVSFSSAALGPIGASSASVFPAFHAEPSNALSLPTWAIHTSSVIEWVVAMMLMWRYADATGNQRWKGMTWGMLPFLASAMCACTWHFFYNNPELEVS